MKFLYRASTFLFNLPILFLISFGLWIYSFRDFIFDRLPLSSDALAYYEHFKVFTDGLRRGVFPMWDPSWGTGIPLEFFLRRIGSFNPFIPFIIAFNALGVPYNIAYLLFLTFYYFFGMVGFYLLAKRIMKNPALAFLAYLLLMFSSLGTRLFDSYILLTFVPMVWFFYFLVAFCQRPQRFYFLGLIFSLMILFTTYIPFYFITIFLTFVVSWVILYGRQCKGYFPLFGDFLKNNRTFVVLSCLVFLISLWPGFLFYQEAQKGEVMFSERHATSTGVNQVSVGIDTVTSWGIEEDIAYANAFTDLRKFKFAIIYLSFFAYLILLVGMMTDINKRILFLFVWACGLILMTTPRISGIYDFLYQHVFYFKYFRNLHFFLWLILLPIFVLFLSEQFKNFLSFQPKTKIGRRGLLVFVLLVHGGFGAFIYSQGANIASSYIVIVLSLLLMSLYILGRVEARHLPPIFLILVVIQPLEVYHYLPQNSPHKSAGYRYGYEFPYLFPRLIENERELERVKQRFAKDIGQVSNFIENRKSDAYIGLRWLNFLKDHLNTRVLDQYISYKILLYDHVRWMRDDQIDIEVIGRAIAEHQNTAFVSEQPRQEGVDRPGSSVQIITGESAEVKMAEYGFNGVKLKTNLSKEKFLVYNDSYYSDWHASIDGREVPLYRANVAFKGLWVPSGEHTVYFRYGALGSYFRNYFLLVLFYAVFIYLLVLGKDLYFKRNI